MSEALCSPGPLPPTLICSYQLFPLINPTTFNVYSNNYGLHSVDDLFLPLCPLSLAGWESLKAIGTNFRLPYLWDPSSGRRFPFLECFTSPSPHRSCIKLFLAFQAPDPDPNDSVIDPMYDEDERDESLIPWDLPVDATRIYVRDALELSLQVVLGSTDLERFWLAWEFLVEHGEIDPDLTRCFRACDQQHIDDGGSSCTVSLLSGADG